MAPRKCATASGHQEPKQALEHFQRSMRCPFDLEWTDTHLQGRMVTLRPGYQLSMMPSFAIPSLEDEANVDDEIASATGRRRRSPPSEPPLRCIVAQVVK